MELLYLYSSELIPIPNENQQRKKCITYLNTNWINELNMFELKDENTI